MTFRSISAVIAGVLLIIFAEVAVAQTPLDRQSTLEITPLYVTSAPTIDGKLDDACWKAAPSVTDFRLNTGKGLARCRTTAWMCCDDKGFYVAFQCEEAEMSKLLADFTQDDEPVWRDDCVEVFLSPHAVATDDNFHHFAVNSLGRKAYLYAEMPQKKGLWQAAATRAGDKWFVELSIPFAVLSPTGQNEPYWRIQFCREDMVHGEASSWSEVPQWFSSFWRFGKLVQPANGPKFISHRGKVHASTSKDTAIGAVVLKDVPSDAPSNPPIIPEPRAVKYLKGSLAVTPRTRILIGKTGNPMDRRPAEEINEEIKRVAGFELPIVAVDSSAGLDFRDSIVVGESSVNPAVPALLKNLGVTAPRAVTRKEGYVLTVTGSTALISGADQLGTFWGAQTFRQLIKRDPADARRVLVKRASVRDWPLFPYRGLHLLATPDCLSFHGRMIEKVLSRFKVNNIVLECEFVEWDSHPEIRWAERAVRKDDVRKLIEIAKAHHITVTPLLQSLGHLEWAFHNKSNMDMVEDPATPYAYCPLNPKSHKFMADLIDETIELFGHPEYVHMGRDEFTNRGTFPYHEECKKAGREKLYVDDAIWNYNYLRSKNTKMMIWGDILTTERFRDKVDQLPKDIVICDWRYGPLKEYPTLSFYKEHGFPVIGCTWYIPENLYNFSLDGYKRGIEGMMQTTWTGFWLEDKVLRQEFYQIYAYVLGAAWAWSPGVPKVADLPYEPDQVFSDLWFTGESKAGRRWFTVDLRPFRSISLVDDGSKVGWLGYGKGEDLSSLPSGVAALSGIPFDMGTDRKAVLLGGLPDVFEGFGAKMIGIPVYHKADRLYFLNTTAFGDRKDRKIGEYIIHYADGSSATVDLVYRQTVMAWNDSSPGARTRSAWRGKTSSGQVVRANALVWENPSPTKEIATIDLVSADTQAAPVLLAITGEFGGE